MYDFYKRSVRLVCTPKFLLVMKLTTLLMIVAIMPVSAITFAQKVTLKVRNAPLSTIFQKIRKQTGYDFAYTGKTLENAKPVTISANNEDLTKVLDEIFKEQPLSFSIEYKTVVISQKQPSILDKVSSFLSLPLDIHGQVINDSTKTPLAGATVRVEGTKHSVVTDADGMFTLPSEAEGAVIDVFYVGYITERVTVTRTNASAIRIAMRPDISKLKEVSIVSNGYQTLSKERSAGSFAKPDMAIIDNRSTSMNIVQRMEGLVPGLTINNAPGSSVNGNQVLVRGLTTVSNNTGPLYVVDGVQIIDPSTINPQDVADITVLKDATAASIWGAKAANGVIVINTKKGTITGKVKITYDAYANFQGKPNLGYMPVLNSQQFIQAAKQTFDPVDYPYATITQPNAGAGLAPHEVLLYGQYMGTISAAQANKGLDSLAGINNNKQIKDLFYRNAMQMNHTLSVSAGQKNYSVYGSLAYTDNVSNSPGQTNNNYGINLRQDFTAGSRVKFTLITALNDNLTNSPRNLSVNDSFYPYQLFQDNAGNNISMPWMQSLPDATRLDYQTRSRISLDYNPLNEVGYGYTKTDAFLSRNNFSATVKLIDGLNFVGTYGYITGTTRTQNYDSQDSYKVRAQVVQFTQAPTAASTPVYLLPATGGNYNINEQTQRNWTVRNQLNYNKDWGNGKHQLMLLAGQEALEQYSVTDITNMTGWNPQLQTAQPIDYKTLNSTITQAVWGNYVMPYSLLSNAFLPYSETEAPISRFSSYFGNAGYTYDHKYTINGSIRSDKSNNFGLDNSAQGKPTWSTGGKWLMTEESFMKNISWLNQLALRATYGITGNAPNPGTASSYDIIIPQTSSFLPNGQGLTISTPANRKLTWERTANINLGIDFSVLSNRLSGSVEVYQKKTSNLLGQVNIDGFTGYSTILGNLGDLQNKGIELSLTSVNINSSTFRWSTTLIGAYNRNLITHLNVQAPVTTGDAQVQQQLLAGYTAYALFAYRYAGLDNLGDPQIRLANGTVTKALNVSKPADIKYMGTTQPPVSGGLSNNFSYKSFGLNINTIFNLGAVMRRDVNQFYTGRLSHFSGVFNAIDPNSEFANRWQKPGDEAITNIPSYVGNSSLSASRRNVNYYEDADINVLSASFIKMRDATLTYNLPPLLVKKINVDGITLRAGINNVMLWKNNKYGIDPEFQNAFAGARSLPNAQNSLTFGINVRL